MDASSLAPRDIVLIAARDDWPEHLFEIWEVHDDCITGQAISGPLAGIYGEPDLDLIIRVHSHAKG